MKMPQHVLRLTTHLRDFLLSIEQGRRPNWNTVERAAFKFCSLKLELHALPAHETVVVAASSDDDSVPAYTDAEDLIPPPGVRHDPNKPTSARFDSHNDADYPAHKPDANPALEPGNS